MHDAIKLFDVGHVEHLPALRPLQEPHCLRQRAVAHLTYDFGEPLVDSVFNHGANVQARPDPQMRSTASRRPFDVVTKCPFDPAGIGCPSVSADQEVAKRLFTDHTALALPLAIMDRDSAQSACSFCATRLVRATLLRRFHWFCCGFLHRHNMPGTVIIFKPPLHLLVILLANSKTRLVLS
jgi:hypothetical protein